jgi:hypothetical protein
LKDYKIKSASCLFIDYFVHKFLLLFQLGSPVLGFSKEILLFV